MFFEQVGNDLNEDAFLFLQNKGMEHFQDTIDYSTVIAYEFMQYSLKRGLKELGWRADTAVTEDLSHIHIRDTFCPESAKHLTKEKSWDALESLMFLKVHREGRVKGQTCADGRKQRKKAVPEDVTSPTVST